MIIDIVCPTCKKIEDCKDLIVEIEDNTPELHRIIFTCQPISAAKNRNFGLSFVRSPVFVMLDDDITGFYPGWLTNLIYPMTTTKNIVMTSARLLTTGRAWNHNMGMIHAKGVYVNVPACFRVNGIEYKRITTACLALRKNDVKFDEKFKGSGYEDTDYSNQLSEVYNGKEFIINNQCELIHINAMTGQGDQEVWQHNHDHYCSKYPWDSVAQSQKWWGGK